MTSDKKKKPVINKKWCKGCAICIEFCPKNALGLSRKEKAQLVYPERCDGCGLCELRCPDLAIELK